MDIAFSIEMAIWVAVGGRADLVGAILGAAGELPGLSGVNNLQDLAVFSGRCFFDCLGG